uniref:CDGSH iron-sulfur domain-containing protein 2 isoform X2 n=1 Tax=Callithrix jacchus TaxID=9483 RepID=UPI0023DD4A5E|nr:CDGSH iron-sulfur domain-containing protein 2 isoform X2 [Callithrix jacchus]
MVLESVARIVKVQLPAYLKRLPVPESITGFARLTETLQARREWGPIFNILKEKNFQPRISYPAKLSFRSEGRIKSFANKQVLRDFVTTRPALQELLKEALHIERINQYQPFQNHTEC